jgi:multicomponent Na+:H+ antiporter subunit D
MLTISYTGDSTYTSGGIFVNQNIDPKIVLGILLLFIFGVAKTGIMPFHKWLPSAMIAPTPVSALLHGVAVVKSGAFIIFKIFVFIFGIDYLNKIVYQLFDFNYLVIIPSITIIVSSAIAMYQNNIKKRLAYSTISQLSYIILTLCVLTPVSAIAGFLHIIAHAFSKIALFFAAGSILVLSHKDEVSELNGISKDLPITMLVFSIGALSLIGFPLTIGFTSKWFILNGAISAENYLVIFVLILSTILNAIYFISIIAMAYKPTNFDALKEDYINNTGEQETQDHTKHTSKAMNTAMIIVAFMVIALNIYADDLISLITN